MAKRLLNRQARLLEYLTSAEAIFGKSQRPPAGLVFDGIDGHLLHLEARFSHEKRMHKIRDIFPRTFEILKTLQAGLIEEFANRCPPTRASQLVNARQFFGFFTDPARDLTAPPHARDVMACELALAEVRATPRPQTCKAINQERRPYVRVRRSRDVLLVRCCYDVRPCFEERAFTVLSKKRDTLLAVAAPLPEGRPTIFELPPPIFDLLAVLDDWTDPAQVGLTAEPVALFEELVQHGLIEVKE